MNLQTAFWPGLCALILTVSCNDAPSAPQADSAESEKAIVGEPSDGKRIFQTTLDARHEGPAYGYDGWPTYPETLEEGDGREQTQAVCSACHSTAYIIGQPPLDESAWEEIVDKMVNAFGAAVPDADHKKIVAYLATHYGSTRHPPKVEQPVVNARGAQIYQSNCVPCHQATGQGIASAFPPLAGHVPEILATPAGRKYLPHVVLYGVQGAIVVKGTSYNNAMPPFSQLPDSDVAAVLNYVATAWGNDKMRSEIKPYASSEIAQERGANGTPQNTHDLRPPLTP